MVSKQDEVFLQYNVVYYRFKWKNYGLDFLRNANYTVEDCQQKTP